MISFEFRKKGQITSDPILRAAGRWVLEAAIDIEEQALLLCPVDTGRLRGSITYATSSARSDPRPPALGGDGVTAPRDALTAHVGSNVEYAGWVEYGTRRTPRQSYLRPALDLRRRYLVDHFRRLIGGAYP